MKSGKNVTEKRTSTSSQVIHEVLEVLRTYGLYLPRYSSTYRVFRSIYLLRFVIMDGTAGYGYVHKYVHSVNGNQI